MFKSIHFVEHRQTAALEFTKVIILENDLTKVIPKKLFTQFFNDFEQCWYSKRHI